MRIKTEGALISIGLWIIILLVLNLIVGILNYNKQLTIGDIETLEFNLVE